MLCTTLNALQAYHVICLFCAARPSALHPPAAARRRPPPPAPFIPPLRLFFTVGNGVYLKIFIHCTAIYAGQDVVPAVVGQDEAGPPVAQDVVPADVAQDEAGPPASQDIVPAAVAKDESGPPVAQSVAPAAVAKDEAGPPPPVAQDVVPA